MVPELTPLEITVLTSIREGKSLDDMLKLARAPASTVGKTVADLQVRGYLADDGKVTKKALQAMGG